MSTDPQTNPPRDRTVVRVGQKPPAAVTIAKRMMRWTVIIAAQITVVFVVLSAFVHARAPTMDVRVTRDSIWDWEPHDGLITRKRVSAELVRPAPFRVQLD